MTDISPRSRARLRERNLLECGLGRGAHCGLMLATGDNLSPLLGFCGNEFSEVGGGAGKHRSAKAANRALILGSARAVLTSLLSFSTIPRGVFLGTDTLPNACLQAGTKSLTLGTSGNVRGNNRRSDPVDAAVDRQAGVHETERGGEQNLLRTTLHRGNYGLPGCCMDGT
jgi:hypothetical protein